jgi:hypothetical protein
MVFKKLWIVTKYGIFGGAIGTTGYLLQKNDWDVSTIGVVRFGRAAWAVSFDNSLNISVS